VTRYNRSHQPVKDIPLEVDRKKYDYLNVVSAEQQAGGTLISVCLSKMKVNGSVRHAGEYDPVSAIYDHYMGVYFIPKNSDEVRTTMVDVATDVFPYYANYTYNPFGQSLNLLMLSYKEAMYKFGTQLLPTALTANLFFKLDEKDLTPHFSWMNNTLANNYLREQTDTTKYFSGLPVKVFTNENGLSTVVSESYSRNNYNQYTRSSQRSRVFETYLGNIGITQFDDDGGELWGIVLPRSQYLQSYTRYYYAFEFSKRWQDQVMFGDWLPQVYARQFLSFNTYSYNKSTYVIYNDYDKNFDSKLGKTDTVFSFGNTNACYYKIDSKRDVTKHYLLGDPDVDEYKCSFIESADFDERTGTYATLIDYHHRKHSSLRMAWVSLN
jgi:hypothetical protein